MEIIKSVDNYAGDDAHALGIQLARLGSPLVHDGDVVEHRCQREQHREDTGRTGAGYDSAGGRGVGGFGDPLAAESPDGRRRLGRAWIGTVIVPLCLFTGEPVSEDRLEDTQTVRFGAEYLLIYDKHIVPLRCGFGYDPVFAPDGETFVFCSNRHNTNEGETNVFLTTWRD